MHNNFNIQNQIEKTLHSIDDINTVDANPYLATRIFAALHNRTQKNIWSKIAIFICKPYIAATAVILLVILNVVLFTINASSSDQDFAISKTATTTNEFAINITSMYDTENINP